MYSIQAVNRILNNCLSAIRPVAYCNPVEWACNNIKFDKVIGSEQQCFSVDYAPYLRDPLMSCEYSGYRRQITIVAPEQTGKTIFWISAFLYLQRFKPTMSMILYPSEPKAEEMNKQKVLPVMERIDFYKKEMAVPYSIRNDRYSFSDSITMFQGTGRPVTSISAQLVICDEVDDFVSSDGVENPLMGAKKRQRSFSESLLILVCTPRGQHSPIYTEFKLSSMGFWHLRCLGCGELTMASKDIHNLQFDLDASENIVNESLTLVCPRCKHQHKESDKYAMNAQGGYIHERPDLIKTNPGYQWGALASYADALSWREIANRQLVAGKSGTYKDQLYFDNSIRGIPFHVREKTDKLSNELDKRIVPIAEYIKPDALLCRFVSIDTQDNHFWAAVFGMDRFQNLWLLYFDKLMEVDKITSLLGMQFLGGYPIGGVIDTGGQRTKEVYPVMAVNRGLIGYKGNSRIGCKYKLSDTEKSDRLFVANPYVYQEEALYLLYASTAQNGNFYMPSTVSKEFKDQLLDMQPNNNVRYGDQYRNWESKTKNDHGFDCLKMALFYREFFIANILPSMLKRMQQK